MKKLIILLLLILNSWYSYSQKNTFENNEIKLNVPKDWKVVKTNSMLYQDVMVLMIPKTEKSKKETVDAKGERTYYNYITVYGDVLKDNDFNAYMQNKKEQWLRNTANPDEINFKKENDSLFIVYYDTNPTNVEMLKRQFFLIHYLHRQNKVYEIQLIAEPDNYDQLLNDFSQVIQSFTTK